MVGLGQTIAGNGHAEVIDRQTGEILIDQAPVVNMPALVEAQRSMQGSIDARRMPAPIAKAVIQIMGKIRRVAKDQRNEHGRYAYASVDDFFAMTGPLCAEASLFVYCAEVERKWVEVIVGDRPVKRMCIYFEFALYGPDGIGWVHPYDRRAVIIQTNDAQSSGAAQSYALKQFLRALFMIPTGEGDADQLAPDPKGGDKPKSPSKSAFPADSPAAAPSRGRSTPAAGTKSKLPSPSETVSHLSKSAALQPAADASAASPPHGSPAGEAADIFPGDLPVPPATWTLDLGDGPEVIPHDQVEARVKSSVRGPAAVNWPDALSNKTLQRFGKADPAGADRIRAHLQDQRRFMSS